jgi:hypothetical protein
MVLTPMISGRVITTWQTREGVDFNVVIHATRRTLVARTAMKRRENGRVMESFALRAMVLRLKNRRDSWRETGSSLYLDLGAVLKDSDVGL